MYYCRWHCRKSDMFVSGNFILVSILFHSANRMYESELTKLFCAEMVTMLRSYYYYYYYYYYYSR